MADAAPLRSQQRAPPLERCAKCNLETYGSNTVHAHGRRYHEHCFHCERCEAPFADGVYFPVAGSLLCADCRDAHIGPWCEKCNGSLAAKERLIAQNKMWHPACFCCSTCGQQIDANYCEYDGQALCERCYDTRHATRCAGCHEAVAQGGIVAEGETWHAACFVCSACAVQLVDAVAGGSGTDQVADTTVAATGDGTVGEGCDYYVLGGRPFCKEHYLDQCTPLCAACQLPADVQPIAALGVVYHHRCFVCAHCKVVIGGGAFIEHEGTAYCQPDYYALFGGRAVDGRPPPERSHAFMLRVRAESVREFAGGHAELWHEVRRELREEGVRNAQAHLFADGTMLLTLALDEARDAEAALTAICERNRACGQWDALLRLHVTPELAQARFLFEAAADPLQLAEGPPPAPAEVNIPVTKRSAAHQRTAMRSSASAPVATFGGGGPLAMARTKLQ